MGCKTVRVLGLIVLGSAIGGCGLGGGSSGATGGKQTLQTDSFLKTLPGATPAGPTPTPTASDDSRQTVADRSGAMPPSVYRADTVDPNAGRLPNGQPAQPAQPNRVTSISPAVRDALAAPAPKPKTSAAAATGAASAKPQLVGTNGGYLTLGAVVTEVSGTPIYADKVVQQLAPLLSSEAKQKDLESYRLLASREIDKQVRVMINNELEYAAALKNLSQEEKDFAWNITTGWRKQQITEAGGSEELARRKAVADGTTFDEKVQDKYREYLTQIFYQKRIFPRIQPTADDMRKYYDRHLKNDFTEVDQAQFRLIKISPKSMGGREQAIDKIRDLRERAVRGDDFEKLASSINHDPGLMKTGGRIGGGDGWVQRGAFAITDVEEAVWKLQPGEVTEVVEVGDAFYIAKLEQRKLGRVRVFEDEEVQNQIRATLIRQQLQIRRDQEQQKLLAESVVYPWPPSTDVILQIAMQNYAQWSTATAAAKP